MGSGGNLVWCVVNSQPHQMQPSKWSRPKQCSNSRNRSHCKVRAPVERAFTRMETWMRTGEVGGVWSRAEPSREVSGGINVKWATHALVNSNRTSVTKLRSADREVDAAVAKGGQRWSREFRCR